MQMELKGDAYEGKGADERARGCKWEDIVECRWGRDE